MLLFIQEKDIIKENFMRNTYLQICEYGSRFRILKGGKISLVVSAFIASTTLLSASPSGGVVTAGSASIAQSGLVTNINQTTQKAAINWNNFSIAKNETVNFNQPNVSSITLNRVVGNEKSIIDGALNANGQVFILNSNGLLFSKNASINTAGLVATTMNLSDTDFMNGNYAFKGDSTASIINQGTITISDKGYAALFGKEVSNEGIIKATLGKVELVGAKEVTLNLNGNSLVNLTVNKGVLDALVENKGAIIADGGEVYLTTNAVNELLKGVVNNSGIVEAQTLDDITGKIELFAHGGTTNVSGKLDATGGFIETSGKDLSVANDTIIKAKTWLIDPVNVTIDSSANAIGGATVGASVIETALSSGGGNTDVIITADNDITVNQALSWSANNLRLSAGNNIAVNANMTATGTGSLAFYYGQASANGGTNRYTVANGIDVLVPNASAFTWKKGSGGTVTNLVFDNGNLRFGNGTQASLDLMGALLQPWYFDNVTSGRNGWYKLTYSSYPLDFAIGMGGASTTGWNPNGTIYSTNNGTSAAGTGAGQGWIAGTTSSLSGAITNLSLNVSKYFEKTGTITTSMLVNNILTKHAYTLDSGAYFLKTITSVTNTSGSVLDNVRLWVGTRDDYVSVTDSNYKTKGNIGANGFTAITTQSENSKAIIISENTFESANGAAILFYSTTDGTDTISSKCCSFNNVILKDPALSLIQTPKEDGSYGLYLNVGNLSTNQVSSVTWYYAAAPVSLLNQAVSQVGTSAGVNTPTPPKQDLTQIVTQITNNTAVQPPVIPNFTPPTPPTQAPQQFSFGGQRVQLMSTPSGGTPTQVVSMQEVRQMQQEGSNGGGNPSGDIRVPLMAGSLIDLVNGGVRLPSGVEQEFFMAQR